MIQWLADALVDERFDDTPPERAAYFGGYDAGLFPGEYRHWIHLWGLERGPGPDVAPGLPVHGPRLSVVVPVYRPTRWYFDECVRSVLEQSYQDWELCLCDDGSDDPELTEHLTALATRDPRIRSLTGGRNGGISRATNRAAAEASGEFVVFLDHDDVLTPGALAEIAAVVMADADADVIYSDEDKLDELGRRFKPHFKPDWDPDMLLSYPYLGHVMAVRRTLFEEIGGLRPEFDGSQDFDLMLRATERARRIVHIPKVLYHWRVVAGSAAGDSEAKPWALQASRRAVEDAVARRNLEATVDDGPFLGAYHVRRRILGAPTVSVIIPFRDQAAMTVTCLDSLERDPGYPIHEVVLVDNGSTEPETMALRRQLVDRPSTRLLDHPGPFNWAAINNEAAATCDSDMLLFLNNDIEAMASGWLAAMVELAQREDTGPVGARLLFPDGTIQHAGVVLGLSGVAGHLFVSKPSDVPAYFAWDRMVRSWSAVTAACMLVRRSVFEEVGGFDERFAVAFNDVDFCIRTGLAGYRSVYTPHAELIHYESVSRGLSGFTKDYTLFLERWGRMLKDQDPYFNPNLSRIQPWCTLRMPGEDEQWLEGVGDLRATEDEPPSDVGASETAEVAEASS